MRKNTGPAIGCVVLAAGNARRFGENKLSATLDGKSMIHRALDALPMEALCAVCVVTQYATVAALARQRGLLCQRNDCPDAGLSRSVRLGTEALAERCDAILYLVADQPLLRRESVAGLLAFARAHPEHIVAAAQNGRRGNPCLFPSRFFPALCALSGDVGGSAVIRQNEASLLLYELPEEELLDVDTGQALQAARTRLRSRE